MHKMVIEGNALEWFITYLSKRYKMFAVVKCFLLVALLFMSFCEAFTEEECENAGFYYCAKDKLCFDRNVFGPLTYNKAKEFCPTLHQDLSFSIIDFETHPFGTILCCLNNALGGVFTEENKEIWNVDYSGTCYSFTFILNNSRVVGNDFSKVECDKELHFFCVAE